MQSAGDLTIRPAPLPTSTHTGTGVNIGADPAFADGTEDQEALGAAAYFAQDPGQDGVVVLGDATGAALPIAQRPRLSIVGPHLVRVRNKAASSRIPITTRLTDGVAFMHQKLFEWALRLDRILMPFAPQYPNFSAIAPALVSSIFAMPALSASMVGGVKIDPGMEVEEDDTDTAPSEESGGIEDIRRDPKEYFLFVEQEFVRIKTRYDSIKGTLTAEIRQDYEKEIAEIQNRLEFWHSELTQLDNFRSGDGSITSLEGKGYAEDISIGERILLDRIQTLAADVYSEPIEDRSLGGIGLRLRVPGQRKTPEMHEEEGGVLAALVNHDVGYGKGLSLRPHQVAIDNRIRGLLKRRQEHLGELTEVQTIPPELLQGTVIEPTGGGKTRQMVATFAAAIEVGAYHVGDKFFIFDHRNQIHGQNKEVVDLLRTYFRKKVNRELKVSEYKAEDKDLSGDVVIVSIPSVSTEDRRDIFKQELRAALAASGGTILIGAVDEIHHMEMGRGSSKESWAELMNVVREVAPNFYRIGFTATPTGHEGPYVARVKWTELMRKGVTPRTYLIKVEGVDLTQLKISATAQDFQTTKLVSVLLGHPERNVRIYDALEEHGLRRTDMTPSGRQHLEGVLGFAADLKHAAMMANDYVDYFGTKSTPPSLDGRGQGEGVPLQNRRLEVVGEDRGRISKKYLNEILQSYRSGAIDGVVAIVADETTQEVRAAILKAVEDGEIEAVFNVGVWSEGADLYMFTHLLGGKSTFSRFLKGQEGGRLNRRGPRDVSPEGKLLFDKPKIIFDVIDSYNSTDRQLMAYGDMLGVQGFAATRPGELFDAMSEQVVEKVDREGKFVKHQPLDEKDRKKIKRPTLNLTPLVAKLWDVYEQRYASDAEAMAIDLGIPVEEMTEILQGKGWINARWFLRRLATLLYQDREALLEIYNAERGMHDDTVTEADYTILQGALTLYQSWGGSSPVITEGLLIDFSKRTASNIQWRTMWRGLAIYFDDIRKVEGERKPEAEAQYQRLHYYLFEREGWEENPTTAEGRLLFAARERVAFRFGGKLLTHPGIAGVPEQGHKGYLTRWLAGEQIEFGGNGKMSPAEFYGQGGQVQSLLKGLGIEQGEIDSLILASVFEQKQWPTTADTAEGRLLLAARRGFTLRFGGRFPVYTGIDGISTQHPRSSLSKWLAGKQVNFGHGGSSTPANFYGQSGQVQSLLKGLGMSEEEIAALIIPAVFEMKGWSPAVVGAEENLRLIAREKVVLRFGGEIPQHCGIDGVPNKNPTTPLTRWLAGDAIEFTFHATAAGFYGRGGRVQSLLKGLGMGADEVDKLIIAAVFERKGWKISADTAEETLRLKAREKVALHFGGNLPDDTGISGVSQQTSRAPLTRWLEGRNVKAESSRGFSTAVFYGQDGQVQSLLKGLGVGEEEIADLIIPAIFEQEGWLLSASTAREKLLLAARREVALYFGGKLPASPEIAGIPHQHSKVPLTRWLSGEILQVSEILTPQIRALLIHYGTQPEEADLLIAAASAE